MNTRSRHLFALLGLGLLPVAEGAPPASTSAVQLFIPGRIVILGEQPALLKIKLKGLETPGRFLSTSPCEIRFTVFDRAGKALFLYPNARTSCIEPVLGINTARGVWAQFQLPLDEVGRAGLPKGRYMVSAHILVKTDQNGTFQAQPTLVSNVARLDLR